MGQDRHDSIDGEAFGSQSVTFSDRLLAVIGHWVSEAQE